MCANPQPQVNPNRNMEEGYNMNGQVKGQTVNYTYLVYIPLVLVSIIGIFVSEAWIIGAIMGSALTILTMHLANDLSRIAQSKSG